MTLSTKLLATQNIGLTQGLKTSIDILQFSNLDLENFLQQQISINPFINYEYDINSNEPEEHENDNHHDDNIEELNFDNLSYEILERKPQPDYHNLITNTQISPITINEYIEENLCMVNLSNQEKLIIHYLINMIDENGYLDVDYNIIARNLKCSNKQIDKAISILQKESGNGLFARNLKECLMLQLTSEQKANNKIIGVINNLNLVAELKFTVLTKKLNMTHQELQKIIHIIKSLDPKPGKIFLTDQNVNIIPDIFIKKHQNMFVIELNDNISKNFIVDKQYYKNAKNKLYNKEEKSTLTEYFNSATNIIQAIKYRSRNLFTITNIIFKHQKLFFLYGIEYLKPLTLNLVAEESNLSVSSVSRIVSNKFLQSNRGTFPLKYFFSSKISNNVLNQEHSSKNIKHLIYNLIKNESDKILSDMSITKELNNNGVIISRRTVTKYREQLEIAPSHIRKKKLAFANLINVSSSKK